MIQEQPAQWPVGHDGSAPEEYRDRLVQRMERWGLVCLPTDDFEALLDVLDALFAAVSTMVPAGMYRLPPTAAPARAPKPPPPELP